MVGSDGPFLIQSSPGHGVFAGSLPSNRQALVARCIYGYVVIAVFDSGGSLVQAARTNLPPSLLSPGHMPGYFEIEEEQLFEYLGRQMGFVPGSIRVREFRLPDEELAVYRLPGLYQDFLNNPAAPDFDAEDHATLPDRITQWREDGRFVLVWGNDYWLNSSGEITDN